MHKTALPPEANFRKQGCLYPISGSSPPLYGAFAHQLYRIIRLIYFPTISNSRFTTLPAFIWWKLVHACV